LDKLPHFIAKRKENFAYLYAGLKQYEEFLMLPTWEEKADPSWFALPLWVRDDAPFERHELTRFLEYNKVETRLIFAGNILKQPGYQHIDCRVVGDLPVADKIMRGAFFVGVYPGLDQARMDYMLEMFGRFFERL
jgi:CDP-6-deoxy-D-xylo-4-hexulose-3-dehydrase